MSEDLIKALAQQVINESIVNNLGFYALMFFIALVATAISSFLVSYVKKRGEAYATKQDFQHILNELKQSTEATENIRSEINARFSHEQERKRLLREKIECVIDLAYSLELWFEQSRTEALSGKPFNTNSSPLPRLEMLVSIYFVESIELLMQLKMAAFPMMKYVLDLLDEHWKAKSSGIHPEYDLESFNGLNLKLVKALNEFRKDILEKYKRQVGL